MNYFNFTYIINYNLINLKWIIKLDINIKLSPNIN